MALKTSGKNPAGTTAKTVVANGNDAGQTAEPKLKRGAAPKRSKR